MLIRGFEPEQAFIVHFFRISVGHLNHANLPWTYGPLKYIFNNPVMHLYHHAYVPGKDGELKLGYSGDKTMPKSFWRRFCK